MTFVPQIRREIEMHILGSMPTIATGLPSTGPGLEQDKQLADYLQRLRAANDLLREFLRSEGPAYEIAFFCECGAAGCFKTVWLTGGEYEGRRRASQPIVPLTSAESRAARALPPNGAAA
jgi:hypothetical protein